MKFSRFTRWQAISYSRVSIVYGRVLCVCLRVVAFYGLHQVRDITQWRYIRALLENSRFVFVDNNNKVSIIRGPSHPLLWPLDRRLASGHSWGKALQKYVEVEESESRAWTTPWYVEVWRISLLNKYIYISAHGCINVLVVVYY